MELVSDLKRRLHEAEMRMFNSEHPEEFKDILSLTVNFNGSKTTVEDILDTHPRDVIYSIDWRFIENEEHLADFITYVKDVCAMRTNFYLRPGDSLKKFASHPHRESTFGDNYSKHEMM